MHVVNIQKSDPSNLNLNAYYLFYVLTGFFNMLVDAILCHGVISDKEIQILINSRHVYCKSSCDHYLRNLLPKSHVTWSEWSYCIV